MSKAVFLKGLNELRALASIGVLLHHVELYKKRDSIESFNFMSFFCGGIGKKCVFIFFVLSGFLITYLLMIELRKNDKINISKFYMRRGLRIWPVYYLLLIIGFFVMPFLINYIPSLQSEEYYYKLISDISFPDSLKAFLAYFFMMPNLGLSYQIVPGISQGWSIGVEEQFYLVWPIVVPFFEKSLFALILLIMVYYFSPEISNYLGFLSPSFLKKILNFFPIYLMATGAVGAKLYDYKQEKVFKMVFENFILFILNTLLFIYFTIYSVDNLLYACIIMLEILFIVNLAGKYNTKIKVLDFIGKISYGIYMYHPLVMFFSFWFLKKIINPVDNNILYNISGYLMIFFVTIIVSWLSYRYLEVFFMKLKNKRYSY